MHVYIVDSYTFIISPTLNDFTCYVSNYIQEDLVILSLSQL